MYCRKCGKEIEEDSFCRYCGAPSGEGHTISNEDSSSEMFMNFREKIRIFGHERLIKSISWIAACLGVINRIINYEVETVYVGLAQEDYFALAEDSRTLSFSIICIQVFLCGLLISDITKRKLGIYKGTYVAIVITLLIQIAAIFLRFPAPY